MKIQHNLYQLIEDLMLLKYMFIIYKSFKAYFSV